MHDRSCDPTATAARVPALRRHSTQLDTPVHWPFDCMTSHMKNSQPRHTLRGSSDNVAFRYGRQITGLGRPPCRGHRAQAHCDASRARVPRGGFRVRRIEPLSRTVADLEDLQIVNDDLLAQAAELTTRHDSLTCDLSSLRSEIGVLMKDCLARETRIQELQRLQNIKINRSDVAGNVAQLAAELGDGDSPSAAPSTVITISSMANNATTRMRHLHDTTKWRSIRNEELQDAEQRVMESPCCPFCQRQLATLQHNWDVTDRQPSTADLLEESAQNNIITLRRSPVPSKIA